MKDEAMKTALEALEHLKHNAEKSGANMGLALVVAEEAITTLRTAIEAAQSRSDVEKQEPVATVVRPGKGWNVWLSRLVEPGTALYLSPPASSQSYTEGIQDAIELLRGCPENSIDWLIDRLGDLKWAAAKTSAAPVQEPVAWAKQTDKKLRITHMNMQDEDGWKPLIYGDNTPPAAPVQYPLPDDMYDSKDWKAGSYVERVEWLHTMYESSKQTLEAYTSAPVQEQCSKCHGLGYYDEGHENDDGSMSGGNYVECEKCKPPAAQRQSAPDPKDRRSAWVGLTDEEIGQILGFNQYTVESTRMTLICVAQAIEAKLKEKNT